MARKNRLSLQNYVKALGLGFTLGFVAHYVPLNELSDLFFDKSFPSITVSNPSKKGLPLSQPILEREGYVLAYDGRIKSAAWVFEEIASESLQGVADRSQFQFISDPKIPQVLKSEISDYKNSGFDCGHLAPAADFRKSPQNMEETFFLSNISPQRPSFNRGYWKHFENYVRDLSKQYGRLEVVTGPLFLSEKKKDGKRYVTFEVIGENEVAVPTHYFKVITVRGVLQKRWAYILPNNEVDEKTPLENFRVSLDTLEKKSGIIFQ